jgi:hypothetical protein
MCVNGLSVAATSMSMWTKYTLLWSSGSTSSSVAGPGASLHTFVMSARFFTASW